MLPSFATHAAAQPAGASPYGSIEGKEPDANGVILPDGFSSRIVAVGGEPVADTGYEWPVFPDGAATFDDGEGGWYHACNSEVRVAGLGGVSAVHYDADGVVLDAYRILDGSIANCAGGPTPWGTWLSCEEDFDEQGLVWECDPTGEADAVAHPAMGRWAHEAVAVDPEQKQLYLTQDHPEGLLYRYTPTDYPDLAAGVLEAAQVADDGFVTWVEVLDPSGSTTPTREQVPAATVFPGGEGIWYHDGTVFFTTKGDNAVHSVDVRAQTYAEIYRADPADVEAETSTLFGVDNITVDAGSGDLLVAEDGGRMRVVIITPEGEVAPFLQVIGHSGSEITGPVFNPRRDRLYFSSQRGPSLKAVGAIVPEIDSEDLKAGVTFEVTGPFRGIVQDPPAETTVPAPTTTLGKAAAAQGEGDDGGGAIGPTVGIGAAVGLVAGASVLAIRRRQQAGAHPEGSGEA